MSLNSLYEFHPLVHVFLPVLLIPVVLPRWARPAGLRSRRKVSWQQVEEDTRRRHDGSQSRQGAHVAPPALRSELPPFTGKLRRKVPIIGGPEAGLRRSSRERVDVLLFSRRTPRKRSDSDRGSANRWLLTFWQSAADGSHGSRRPTALLRGEVRVV